jgi:MFS family permease
VQAGDGMCYQEMNLIHRVFWFSVPISVVVLIQLWFFLPLVKVSGNMKSKLKKIDYGGSLISLAATIFVLVSVSGGGVKYAWNSAIVIVMLTLGVVLFIVFILYEIYVARIPIMPSMPPIVKPF